MEKNYIIRKDELRKKVRRDFHRPTRSERDPKVYSRKEKHRTFYFEIEAEQVFGRCGEIGRRAWFKPKFPPGSAGSSPVTGTIFPL